MTFRIFQEPRQGTVRHTPASKMLAENPLLRQWTGMISEELWPAATKVGHNPPFMLRGAHIRC